MVLQSPDADKVGQLQAIGLKAEKPILVGSFGFWGFRCLGV